MTQILGVNMKYLMYDALHNDLLIFDIVVESDCVNGVLVEGTSSVEKLDKSVNKQALFFIDIFEKEEL